MREVREISIEQLHPNRHQPRLEFNEDALMELAQSIRENGLIQPITARMKMVMKSSPENAATRLAFWPATAKFHAMS